MKAIPETTVIRANAYLWYVLAILTTCSGSVCQMGARLVAVSGVAEWRQKPISFTESVR